MQQSRVNTNLILAVAVVGGAVLLVQTVKGGIKSIFVPKSADNPVTGSTAASNQAAQSYSGNPAWNQDYWRQFGNPPGVPVGKLKYWSEIIPIAQGVNSQFSWYIPILDVSSVDFPKLMSLISKINNKAQFSQLVWYYNNNYGRDLYSDVYKYLLGNMVGGSNPYLSQFINYVDKLPS